MSFAATTTAACVHLLYVYEITRILAEMVMQRGAEVPAIVADYM